MDIQRFEQLSGAYGGDPRRWPQAERDAAEALMAADPAATSHFLGGADSLDAALDAWTTPAPSAALRNAILAGAPRSRRPVLSLADAFRAWLPGAGFAAAAVAGVLMGVMLMGAVGGDIQSEALVAAATPDEPAAIANWLEGQST